MEEIFAMEDEVKELQRQFGSHIQHLREAKKLSKTAFADLLGKERIDVSQIERGERNVTLRTLLALAKALEVPLFGLLDFEGQLFGLPTQEPKQATSPKSPPKKAAKKTKRK